MRIKSRNLSMFIPRNSKAHIITGYVDKKRRGSYNDIVTSSLSSGGRTRTSGLRVMGPTSYQLLYPAMYFTIRQLFLTYPNFYRKKMVACPSFGFYGIFMYITESQLNV